METFLPLGKEDVTFWRCGKHSIIEWYQIWLAYWF